jgi:vacuolar-type H+-ATPase subunit C/Vma6
MLGGSVADYSTIHAQVRGMYASLLSPQLWDRLREAASFSELTGTLKETIYAPYLTQVEEADLTPRRAVYQIKMHLAKVYTGVLRLAPGFARPVLNRLYRLYETDNLKAILRGVVAGAPWDTVRYVLFPLGASTVLPAQAMVEAGSVGAAVEQLRRTPYYATLAHALQRYSAEGSLFPLEVALDLDDWRELWHDVKRLPAQDRPQALRIVGTLADLNNLMWAIRYRVYHHLSEEEIINYTLPFGYQVKDQDIHAIAAGAGIASVMERIYPGLSVEQEPERRLPELELHLQRQLVERCQAAFIGYPFHIGIPLAYLVLAELEIQDLTVLIEAKAMHIPAARFQAYLVMGASHVLTPLKKGIVSSQLHASMLQ